MKKSTFIIVALLASLFSCNKKDENVQIMSDTMGKGLFVLNEGNFTASNSSLTFIDTETDTVCNNLFFKVNGSPIGDVGQSLTLFDNSLYIVMNNSNYIYKVDAETMEYQAKLEGFYSPRYMLPVTDTKAYVSDMVATGLWIINPQTMQQVGFIETGSTTEQMVKIDNEVFVTNYSNFYQPGTSDNTLQVIDIEKDSLVTEVPISREPHNIVVDKHKNVWVLCQGGYDGVMNPSLYCIDHSTKKIENIFNFNAGTDYPMSLAIDPAGETLYYMNGGFGTLDVYRMSIESEALPREAFVKAEGRNFYNVSVSPDNEVFVTDAKSYMENGDVLRYSDSGGLLETYEAGIIPGFMLFNTEAR